MAGQPQCATLQALTETSSEKWAPDITTRVLTLPAAGTNLITRHPSRVTCFSPCSHQNQSSRGLHCRYPEDVVDKLVKSLFPYESTVELRMWTKPAKTEHQDTALPKFTGILQINGYFCPTSLKCGVFLARSVFVGFIKRVCLDGRAMSRAFGLLGDQFISGLYALQPSRQHPCLRCGETDHFYRDCGAEAVRCDRCNSTEHNTLVSRTSRIVVAVQVRSSGRSCRTRQAPPRGSNPASRRARAWPRLRIS